MKQNSLWQKRIPTLLGVFLILLGTIATSLLVKNSVIFTSRANLAETPQDIRITNISSNSFTVSYTTEESVGGFVVFGKDKTLGQNALDDRNQPTGTITPYKTHYISIKNLSPSTKYYFSIMSGSNSFLNNDIPFETTTASVLNDAPANQLPVSGKVIEENGSNPTEAIVYVTTDGAQTVSGLVKSDGVYIVPLNSMRDTSLSSYFLLQKTSVLQILAVEGKTKSIVSVLTSQANPVPPVTLAKNYDFTIGTSPLESETTDASLAAKFHFPSFVASESASKDPKIITPGQNQSFTDPKPLFKGTGLPNEEITIAIHSPENLQTKIKTDAGGNWTYRPDSPLSVGQHTILVTAHDRFGILKTITQSFTVYAAGTQVNQSATPSASPTISIPPSPTPTVLIAPTIPPTSTPIPIINSAPKGGNRTVSPPGNSILTTLGIPALITTGLGIFLFFLTRGSTSL